jgi:hypothetical protein
MQMDMKKLLLSAIVIFGSAQLFIHSVIFFTEGNKLRPRPSQPNSNINSDLPVKLKRPAGTLNNSINFETGIKNRLTANNFSFVLLPYNISKINGLRLFDDPYINLNNFGLISAYNWKWRLAE